MTENEQKQIEELENHLYEIEEGFIEYCDNPCTECEHNKFLHCVSRYKAERLYAENYRKVVCCKNCIYWHEESEEVDGTRWGDCSKPMGDYRYSDTAANDYCSYGKLNEVINNDGE